MERRKKTGLDEKHPGDGGKARKEGVRTEADGPGREERQTTAPAAETRPDGHPPAVHGHLPAVVGIGASAGGLKALEAFFDHLPPDNGLAFVVVQHLDPNHESMMVGILGRHTRLEVQQVQDGARPEPNRVYLKPPGQDVALKDGTFRLSPPPEGKLVPLPVDTFFRSLAEDQRERGICIILSGAGRDGTLGLKAVKETGGLVMVQAEEQAEYTGMPGSAIDTGLADFILPVEKMPEELLHYVHHPSILAARPGAEASQEALEAEYQKILMIVRTHVGTDFSHYKRSTLSRRIARRLALHHLGSLSDYLRFLRQHPQEVDALFRDLIISVTRFFRDPEAWAALTDQLASGPLSGKEDGEEVRAWVAGCSTGEEVYSTAIMLQEAGERAGKRLRVKLFATDLNAESIEAARTGVYPDSIAADVGLQRLERYFTRRDSSYRIGGELRETVVFSVHDLTRDPPFSQLDLVVCRNLFIYLDPSLQRDVLPRLHYGLKPGGLLFLGPSEGIGDLGELFTPIDSHWKIYRARGAHESRHPRRLYNAPPERGRPPDGSRGEPGLQEEGAGESGRERREPVQAAVEQAVLEKYTPPAVLVDRDHRILYFHGDTGRYLNPPRGVPDLHLLQMVRPELRQRLQRAMRQAAADRKAVTEEGLFVRCEHQFLTVDLTVAPFGGGGGEGQLLVTFEERTLPEQPGTEAEEADTDSRLQVLRHELYAARQDLQATIEELETANEELKSANEELQANNEELQSTNELMETSREELQSTNEELETVNMELQQKNGQLARAHDDLLNLFSSSRIGSIFLDAKLLIKRFTPTVERLFHLIEGDIGRPITDLVSRLRYPSLAEDARQVLRTLERKEQEVLTEEGQWYAMDIRPYRTRDNVIEGVVITFADITGLKRAERRAEEAGELNESIMETMREPFLVLDGVLTVVAASKAFHLTFRTTPQETVGRPIYRLGNGQWDLPDLRSLLEQVIQTQSEFEDYRVEQEFPRIGRRVMLLNGRRITRQGKPDMTLLAFEEESGYPGRKE